MKNCLVKEDDTIKEAMKLMDAAGLKTVFITDHNNILLGALSDGDIRRALLAGVDLNQMATTIANNKPETFLESYNIEDVKQVMLEKMFEAIPIVNENNEIRQVLYWNDVFSNKPKILEKLNLPVVIMAGGVGARLEPFTKIFPKPLIPIGDKTMIELIMEEFELFGMTDFFLTVNHKANMIKAFFECHEKNYSVTYIDEPEPLGTAGSLIFLKDTFWQPFFVTNCDIIIKTDYNKIFDFHNQGDFDITLVASIQHYKIPYGICEIEKNGELKEITEKPEYDMLVNTGLYLLNPSVLKMIPGNTFFHITDLMKKVKSNNGKVGVYPVSENSWIDVGQWAEYKKASEKLTGLFS